MAGAGVLLGLSSNQSGKPVPVLSFTDVVKRYGGQTAVDCISFAAGAGETLALIGESGCGKTTTLKMINRLIEPDAGEIDLFGEDIASHSGPELRRRIGYVFQEIGLFPHLSVAENIGITPQLLGWPAERISERVDTLLDMMRLDAKRMRGALPSELSGGQQQRVGIARALAAEPQLILMDEAFGALDPLTRDELRRDFKQVQKDLGLTAILVTHDMTEAVLMADRIVVMKHGRIVQDAPPSTILNAPADAYVAGLLDAPQREIRAFAALKEG